MNMDIQYEGCTAQPDDRLSADGQLDAALDLVPENGTLKPFVQPASAGTLTLTDTQKLFVHQTAEYTHYLVADTSDGVTLSWAASLDDTELAEIATLDGQEFLSLVCIGNTVVVSASTQLAYFLWRAADGAYVYLGDRVPDPKIQFALKSHLVTKTYEDTGITTTSTTSTNTTADGTWTDVASAIGTGPPTTGEGTAIVAAMDSDFTIEAGTQYRVCIEWITGKWEGAGAVWGTNSSGTACTLFAWTYNSACVPFSVTADYTDIEVRVVSFRTGVTTTYRAYIQQGATAVEGRVVEYNEENYNALMARMNKYVQDQAVDKGRFIYPFFVRYAVRMFDGSHSYVSPPALMIPNTGFVPFLFFYYGASSGDIKASAFTADLQYMIGEEIEEEWEDVIDGVDIYISQPIYPYDQSAEYDEGETLLSYGQ